MVVSYDENKQKNYFRSAGQFFEVKIDYVDIVAEEFEANMKGIEDKLNYLFAESIELEKEIQNNLKGLNFE